MAESKKKMSAGKKVLLVIVCILLVLALAVGAFFGMGVVGMAKIKKANAAIPMEKESFSQQGLDRIHFLSTGSSDAILLESDGHFALIDAAEDADFPADKPNLEYTGYEQEVLAYLKAHAAGSDGKVVLDFILATHWHSDHVGGFDTLLADPDVTVMKAFVKPYHSDNITKYELTKWDNQEVYDQTIAALTARNVEMVTEIPTDPFSLGHFTIQFFNTEMDLRTDKKIGENDNSVVTKVTKGERSAVLTGDFDHLTDDEQKYADAIGKTDLLKLGHHGYIGSTSQKFLDVLSPSITVATNKQAKIYPNIKWNVGMAGAALFPTVDNGGLTATFTDDGTIVMANHTMA